uniref:MATE efflux family protein n=2 Tax=Opuntia streptacantha TaxID=393608 RepID=A0A7C9AAZ7_OPUST
MNKQIEDSIQAAQGNGKSRKSLPSVSTALILAAVLGFGEAVALFVGSGFLMNIMGIPVDSPMRQPAEQFLTIRAFGTPAIVIALAAQGAYRGFQDTRTPFYAIGAGNLLNAILDPILIFFLGFGIGGAAIATVISEYLIASILLWKLNREVSLTDPNIDGRKFLQYLKSGGLLIARTSSVLLPMTLATSMAARQGPVPMAGHQICVQVWLTMSLLTDALAIAGQALLASYYSQGNYQVAEQVIYRVLQVGLVMGIGLAAILFLGFGLIVSLFTSDAEVLKIAWSGILFVAGSQPVNAIAFVLDGLYYGVSDFEYAAYSMVVAALISSAFVLFSAPVFGLPGVWTGLFLFMSLRVVAGSWRLGTRNGPWIKIWTERD